MPAPTGPSRSNNYQALLLTRDYGDKFDGDRRIPAQKWNLTVSVG